jgi:hypothetical protein
MKKTFTYFSFLLVILLIFAAAGKLQAQCATDMSPEEFIRHKNHLDKYFSSAAAQRITETPMVVPVTIHVIRKSDGSGGTGFQQILDGFTLMNRKFADAGIQFYVCGTINYINSDGMYNYYDSVSTTRLPVSYDVPNTVNVIYHNTLHLPGFGYAGGFASFPGGSLRIHMSTSSDKYTLAHEMGHFWGLPHTFQYSDSEDKNLKELVTRGPLANCSTAGDGICDTPADPFVYKKSRGYFPGCVFTDTVYDSNHDRFAPMVNNIMSYYSGCEEESFTSGQYTVVKSYKTSQYRTNWSTSCPQVNAPTSLTAAIDPKYGIKLTWNDNASNELAYEIEVSAGNSDNFRTALITPANSKIAFYGDIRWNTTYYFRIKPLNSATAYSNTASITTTKYYCVPMNTNNCLSDNIINGEYASIGFQKITLDGETLLNNVTGCGTNSYDIFSSPVIKVYKGMPYLLLADIVMKNGVGTVPDVAAWIDLNEDGEFSDVNEKWILHTDPEENWDFTTTLKIASTVTSGIKRMRIRSLPLGSASSVSACTQILNGETEDYLIDVQPKPAGLPVVLDAQYNSVYKGNLSWTYSTLASNTKCYVYSDFNGKGFRLLDSVTLGQNSLQMLIKKNGSNSYLLRKAADHSLISNIDSVKVSDIVYCVPDYTIDCSSTSDNAISNVKVAGELLLNNSSLCSNQSFAYYPDKTTSLYKGIPYVIEVQQLYQPNQGMQVRKVTGWIDFDNNGSFDDNGELIPLSYASSSNSMGRYTGKIIVPATAGTGFRTLRVRLHQYNPESCEQEYTGETEDYKIEIKAFPASLPVTLTASQASSSIAALSWTYTNLSESTLCYLYRSYSNGDIRKTDSVLISQKSAQNILSGIGEYKYWIRKASDNSIISNVATINVTNFVKPYTLTATNVNKKIRVSWNNPDNGLKKAVLWRTPTNYPDYFLELSTVNLIDGYFDDTQIAAGDTSYRYVLRTPEGDTLSNIASVKITSQICRPTFKNTDCLGRLSTTVFYQQGNLFENILQNPYCAGTNRFIEPGIGSIPDTLNPGQVYDFMVFLDNTCAGSTPGPDQYSRNIKIWIDLNDDAEFTNDEIILASQPGEYLCSYYQEYELPSGVKRGNRKIRYIITDKNYPVTDPCGTYQVGTGYDQLVFINTEEIPTAAENQVENLYLTVYPNPATDGKFTIESNRTVEKISISNLTGKVIYQGPAAGINSLPAGFYLFDIWTEGSATSSKVRFISEE